MAIELNSSATTDRTGVAPARPSVARALTRAGDNAAATAAGTASESSRSVSNKAQRHGQWALIAQAQTRIADLQAAEQAVVAAYRQLLQVSRQLEHQNAGPQRDNLARQVEQLAAQLRAQQPAALDKDLVPVALQKGGGNARFVLTRVDLLTPRPQSEQLQLVFSGGRQVAQLDIPAQAGADQVVQALRGQLSTLGIQVGLNPQRQLEFSVPAAEQGKLSAPLLVTGQGIRVPAGNPVPIQLEPSRGVLEEVAGGVRGGDLAAQRDRIRQVLSGLEYQRRQLQAHSQQIISRLSRIRGDAAAAGEALQLGQQLAGTLRDAGFAEHVGVLLAQANVSRHTAVALLAK